jgi:hypothetical protein
VVRLNKPTSTCGDDSEEIHYQKDVVQRIVHKKPLKPKSLNTPESHSYSHSHSKIELYKRENTLNSLSHSAANTNSENLQK